MPDGKPVIGPVPGFSNVFIAAGHEGEGLTLVQFHTFSSFLNVSNELGAYNLCYLCSEFKYQ